MILHPTGLKGCVLPIVCEDQQTLSLRMLNHVLREHMHVRHIDCPNFANRLTVATASRASSSAARYTTAEPTRMVLQVAYDKQTHRFAHRTAATATRELVTMR